MRDEIPDVECFFFPSLYAKGIKGEKSEIIERLN